jgi:cephalosporin-C deacetylase-like acetyl esterase
MNTVAIAHSLILICAAPHALAQPAALFDYDRSVPFQYSEEPVTKDTQIEVAGAGFQSPKGGKVRMLVVRPTGRGPYAGIIYQHGGGTSMLTYLAEAEILARAGAVSLILDAPGAAPGKFKPMEEMSAAEMRDYYAEIVICYRRAIDYLQSLKIIDPARIGFAGHSYGGITGGVLAGIDRRVKTFALIGAIARYTSHIAENPAQLWVDWRKRIGPARIAEELQAMRPIDPDRYLSAPGHVPLLIQCGNFDFYTAKDCETLANGTSSPKDVRWYDTDHEFADLEATVDRLKWFERDLRLKPVAPLVKHLIDSPLKRPARRKGQ